MRIDEIEIANEDRDEKVMTLQRKVDNLDQTEKAKKLILTGTKTEASPMSAATKLNDLLRMKVKAEDIHYVTKLKTDSTGPEKLKIVFHAKILRDSVFREIKKLKGKCVWLTEDLSLTRLKLLISQGKG